MELDIEFRAMWLEGVGCTVLERVVQLLGRVVWLLEVRKLAVVRWRQGDDCKIGPNDHTKW